MIRHTVAAIDTVKRSRRHLHQVVLCRKALLVTVLRICFKDAHTSGASLAASLGFPFPQRARVVDEGALVRVALVFGVWWVKFCSSLLARLLRNEKVAPLGMPPITAEYLEAAGDQVEVMLLQLEVEVLAEEANPLILLNLKITRSNG